MGYSWIFVSRSWMASTISWFMEEAGIRFSSTVQLKERESSGMSSSRICTVYLCTWGVGEEGMVEQPEIKVLLIKPRIHFFIFSLIFPTYDHFLRRIKSIGTVRVGKCENKQKSRTMLLASNQRSIRDARRHKTGACTVGVAKAPGFPRRFRRRRGERRAECVRAVVNRRCIFRGVPRRRGIRG